MYIFCTVSYIGGSTSLVLIVNWHHNWVFQTYPYDPNKRNTFDPSATSAVTCGNKKEGKAWPAEDCQPENAIKVPMYIDLE